MNFKYCKPVASTPPPHDRALRRLWLLASLSLLGGWVQAQAVSPPVAVPFYTPATFMQGVYQYGYAPKAADFARQSAALSDVITGWCDGNAASSGPQLARVRTHWQATATAWDRLAGVQMGPLVQRRSARQIDFTPTRPALIERAIQAQPTDAPAMERIGTPAKGLPALEWLLWTRPITPGAPDCRYAAQVAADIGREAQALSTAFSALAAQTSSDQEDSAGAAMAELVNQWVAGLERLRWAAMEKPTLSAASGAHQGVRLAGYPRNASGNTGASWAAHWQALRTLAVATPGAAPAPGMALVSLEDYLRGRGLNPLADTLVQGVARADKALNKLTPAQRAGLSVAVRELAQLKKLAEAEVAPALEVNIGFSDADGD
jgi:predicted lipoprotein